MKAVGKLGQGRIYRKPGKSIWMLDYYAPGSGKDAGRTIRVRESAKTDDEQKARALLGKKVARARVAEDAGEFVETPANKKTTVAELLGDYLADMRLRECKGVRAEENRLGKDSPLQEALGHEKASRLSLSRLSAYAAMRRERDECANATINRDLQGLRAALKLARRAGKLARLPEFPEKLRETVRTGFFSSEEVSRLCEPPCPSWLSSMIRFAFTTGWRLGELLALRWEWVDAEEVRLPDSKNGEGRVVPLAGELSALFEELRAARRVRSEGGSVALSEFVFHWDGRPISEKVFYRRWTAARKHAKLPGRKFHDFRRSGARRMTRAGVPEVVAMRIIGHRTTSMFRRYSIVETEDLAQALARVQEREPAPERNLVALPDRAPDRAPQASSVSKRP